MSKIYFSQRVLLLFLWGLCYLFKLISFGFLLSQTDKIKEIDLELNTFVEEWKETPERIREVFLQFKEYLGGKEGVSFEFIARPGVTYSLRAAHAAQKKRGLFAMIDVIEDTPRWLSVCFYGEMTPDPEEKGDFVPEGLLGEDAVCFDVEDHDEELLGTLKLALMKPVSGLRRNRL